MKKEGKPGKGAKTHPFVPLKKKKISSKDQKALLKTSRVDQSQGGIRQSETDKLWGKLEKLEKRVIGLEKKVENLRKQAIRSRHLPLA
ncbi:hypothetical protein A2V71_01085 [Candidatus Berkelbacteria bacterium RBG_13_40_8]|uniref:Uncharacterized protein n=1 Tax=Candidatus Berkelbacteria bacterium RBG_13_40_8 TaxID=1797467 RepID=A0A1F5DNU6_9BACT|nr:MAG: hypothetical protein A2V71_01085 [Candidatus Berkelbacteria bacterium RBG_13_40_8]